MSETQKETPIDELSGTALADALFNAAELVDMTETPEDRSEKETVRLIILARRASRELTALAKDRERAANYAASHRENADQARAFLDAEKLTKASAVQGLDVLRRAAVAAATTLGEVLPEDAGPEAIAVQALYATAGQSGSHRIVSALRAVEAWLREDGAL